MNNKKKFMIQDFLIQLEQINYLEILEMLSPWIICYINSRVIDTYTLHKQYKPKNIKKVILPPELKIEYSEIDINNIASTKLREQLTQFINVMVENFPKEDLVNFYNNINTLKTQYNTFKLRNFVFGYDVAGTYNVKENKIAVNENNFTTTIFHELFHMASSIYKDGIYYSGFDQASLKPDVASLGSGINEGYTELLRRRYFKGDIDCVNSYEYEVFVAEQLEKIIGQRKMTSLYLNANLSGLIEELKQYSSEEEIMEFISSTDFILKHLDDKKFELFEKRMINNSLKNINKFLIKSYSKKLLMQYIQNSITNEQFTNKLAEYFSSLPEKLIIEKNVYQLLSKEEFEECFEEVFGKEFVSISIDDEENTTVSKK